MAVVLNHNIIPDQEIKESAIIPGRAMIISIQWHANLIITILNIYAPNATSENSVFWKEIKLRFDNQRIPKPNIMLSNFNIVEDRIDRLPCKHDNTIATESLQELRNYLSLVDGWRTNSPTYKIGRAHV